MSAAAMIAVIIKQTATPSQSDSINRYSGNELAVGAMSATAVSQWTG